MEKLISKGKHKVKVGNHLHTNISKIMLVRRGEQKYRILGKHLKLKDQQLKIILFIYRLLYQSLMVTTNQKSTVDTHTKKKKESNTTLTLAIKSQEKRTKEEGKKKDLQNQIQNN